MTPIFRHTTAGGPTDRSHRERSRSAPGSLELSRKFAVYVSLALLVVLLTSVAAWLK
jgi:hypothetical protein